MAKKKRKKSPKRAVKSKRTAKSKKKSSGRVARPKARAVALPAPREMNNGKLFLGAIFVLIAAYIFLTQTGIAVQMFGSGIVLLLALIFLYAGFRGE